MGFLKGNDGKAITLRNKDITADLRDETITKTLSSDWYGTGAGQNLQEYGDQISDFETTLSGKFSSVIIEMNITMRGSFNGVGTIMVWRNSVPLDYATDLSNLVGILINSHNNTATWWPRETILIDNNPGTSPTYYFTGQRPTNDLQLRSSDSSVSIKPLRAGV